MVTIQVALVEDQPLTRQGLTALIGGTPGFGCAGSWRTCEEMLPRLPEVRPDVLLLDVVLPGMSGIDGARRAREVLAGLPILMLTVHEDNERVLEALCAGACGYLVKKTPPARLLEAIREAHEGGSPMSSQIARRVVEVVRSLRIEPSPETTGEDGHLLTSREREILRGLAAGNTYQTAARTLGISTDTVRFHIRKIYRKLQAHSQSEAVAKALRQGLL
ncbi:MAG TPA: response regulator transcription factor [Thermoanaerobaculia bacterium]|nr:response regulator transcription factor [Thermoanaerobaculia bacterium]